MEKTPVNHSVVDQVYNPLSSEALKLQVEPEKLISKNVMSIRLCADGLTIKESTENTEQNNEYASDQLPGVYCQGVQYYDLNGINFINNAGMAILIDILKSLLEMGVEVQFVNVSEKIKNKIKEAGLENIINCPEKQGLEKRLLL